MGYKSRTQLVAEQMYETQSLIDQITTAAYEIIEDVGYDDGLQTLLDLFDHVDAETVKSVWHDVCLGESW